MRHKSDRFSHITRKGGQTWGRMSSLILNLREQGKNMAEIVESGKEGKAKNGLE